MNDYNRYDSAVQTLIDMGHELSDLYEQGAEHVLLALNIEPNTATGEQWQEARAAIGRRVRASHGRTPCSIAFR